MICDLHTHILQNVDDGSISIDESINILKSAAKSDIKKIILTPHFGNGFEYNQSDVLEKFQKLKKKIIDSKIDIQIYLGCEIYYKEVLKNIEIIKNFTLSDSNYLLIELREKSDIKKIKDIFYELKLKNIVPIIAHIERYGYTIEQIRELKNTGSQLQLNMSSLIGNWGSKVKKASLKLLKNELIDFVSSDVHQAVGDRSYHNWSTGMKKLKKSVSQDYLDNLLYENALNTVFKNSNQNL